MWNRFSEQNCLFLQNELLSTSNPASLIQSLLFYHLVVSIWIGWRKQRVTDEGEQKIRLSVSVNMGFGVVFGEQSKAVVNWETRISS